MAALTHAGSRAPWAVTPTLCLPLTCPVSPTRAGLPDAGPCPPGSRPRPVPGGWAQQPGSPCFFPLGLAQAVPPCPAPHRPGSFSPHPGGAQKPTPGLPTPRSPPQLCSLASQHGDSPLFLCGASVFPPTSGQLPCPPGSQPYLFLVFGGVSGTQRGPGGLREAAPDPPSLASAPCSCHPASSSAPERSLFKSGSGLSPALVAGGATLLLPPVLLSIRGSGESHAWR